MTAPNAAVLAEIPAELDGVLLRDAVRREMALILEFLRSYTAKFGRPPAIGEISQHLWLIDDVSYSLYTVHLRLNQLLRAGLIEKRSGRRCYIPLGTASKFGHRQARERITLHSFMLDYQRRHQRLAPIREMSAHLRQRGNLRYSRAVVAGHLSDMVALGLVERVPPAEFGSPVYRAKQKSEAD